jgi:L-fucose mutarotase
MLKNVPEIISPHLIKILMEMGHGDEICLADGNFPAESNGKRVVRMDGHGAEPLLAAILQCMPLDTVKPAALMDNADPANPPEIWAGFRNIIQKSDEKDKFDGFEMVERYAFYERARNCFAIVATGEKALFANIILKKGVVTSHR